MITAVLLVAFLPRPSVSGAGSLVAVVGRVGSGKPALLLVHFVGYCDDPRSW